MAGAGRNKPQTWPEGQGGRLNGILLFRLPPGALVSSGSFASGGRLLLPEKFLYSQGEEIAFA
jgi:hypothetical protein